MQMLNYDPVSGIFTWKCARGNQIFPGDRAGAISGTGYIYIEVDYVSYRSSRLAWLFITGELPETIDHKDRNRANDKFDNLRAATRSENARNASRRKDNTTGYKGVSFIPSGYKAYIMINGKQKHLGVFKTAPEAHQAYLREAEKVFGQFSTGG